MTVSYRDPSVEDATELNKLFDAVFRGTFAHLYAAHDLEEFLSGFASGLWQAQLRDPAYVFRLAEVAGEPAGYAKLGPLELPVEDASAVMLHQLYVLKDHHGSGIAKALMDWAVDKARRRRASALYLTVFIDNHRARRFYDRYGFEPAGRFQFMVGSHPDEDIIMKKVL